MKTKEYRIFFEGYSLRHDFFEKNDLAALEYAHRFVATKVPELLEGLIVLYDNEGRTLRHITRDSWEEFLLKSFSQGKKSATDTFLNKFGLQEGNF